MRAQGRGLSGVRDGISSFQGVSREAHTWGGRDARGRGLGAALLQAAEDCARAEGKTLLVLDTVTGSAGYRLYERGGWTRVGEIPNYALMPDGAPCPTTYFYKEIG